MPTIGRHAFVTGGGSGIGLAIAKALTKQQWRVTIAGRNKPRLQAALGATPGARLRIVDVTKPDSVEGALHAAVDINGPVQLLVNNAGAMTSAPFEKTGLSAWRQALDLNLMGAVHCTHAVLADMKAARWGRIVNIASTAGLVGYRYATAYVASKHALVGFTKALAIEVARSGVTVNAICPGFTDTDVVANAVKAISKASNRSSVEALATFTAANPQNRLVLPDEIAAAVLWLASEEAAAVNGIALPIAGGEVA